MEGKVIFRLDDKISFRKCSLQDGKRVNYGDCTNLSIDDNNYTKYYSCAQEGLHFHCTKHPEIEFEENRDYEGNVTFVCPKCGTPIEVGSRAELRKRCLRLLNIPEFKDATLIRLDDWYVPEVKRRIETDTDYWVKADVKTDKDGDTIIVLYVGHKGDKEKVQYFIKPEKGQLTSDHKDMDPSKILSKIEVTLKGRKITQEYDD